MSFMFKFWLFSLLCDVWEALDFSQALFLPNSKLSVGIYRFSETAVRRVCSLQLGGARKLRSMVLFLPSLLPWLHLGKGATHPGLKGLKLLSREKSGMFYIRKRWIDAFPDCAVIINKELESVQKCCDKCVNFAKTSVYVFSAKLSYVEKQAFSLLYL